MKKRRPGSICKNCGVQFYDPKHADRKFCTMKCSKEYASKNPSPKLKQLRPFRLTGENVKCKNCGKEVYKPKNQIERSRNLFCGQECSKEYQSRKKIKIICKVCGKEKYLSPSFANQKFCSLSCRDKDMEIYESLLQRNQQLQKSEPTKIELIGYEILKSLGITFEMQYLIENIICVDVYIPAKRMIVQFDGDYWHGNPEMYLTLDKRQLKRKQLDAKQDDYLKSKGYKILRIWEKDIKNNKDKVIKMLSEAMK